MFRYGGMVRLFREDFLSSDCFAGLGGPNEKGRPEGRPLVI